MVSLSLLAPQHQGHGLSTGITASLPGLAETKEAANPFLLIHFCCVSYVDSVDSWHNIGIIAGSMVSLS